MDFLDNFLASSNIIKLKIQLKISIVAISTLLISSLSLYGQNKDTSYLAHGHNDSCVIYSYAVAEITIHKDSTYTWKTWELENKKSWKKYKSFKPKISTGKVTQKAEFHTLTEYRNGNETNFHWTVKISDKRLIFYYPNKRDKLRKTFTYKRIRKQMNKASG